MPTSLTAPIADIVHVVPQMGMGGMERGVLEICKGSKQQGLNSIVVSGGGPWAAELESSGVGHINIPIDDESVIDENARTLSRVIEQSRCRIVHVRSRVSRMLAVRLLSLIDIGSAPKIVSSAHSYHDADDDLTVLSAAGVIIAVSRDLARHLGTVHPDLRNRIRVVPNGVDLDHFSRHFQPSERWLSNFDARYPQLRGKHIVAMVARLSKYKGQKRFLRILTKLQRESPQLHGLIVGPTPLPRHHTFARKLVRNIRWKRMTNVTIAEAETDVRNIYAIADLTLSLSHDPPETYGRTLMESLASGVPIVGYNHGGAREFAFSLFPDGAVDPLDDDAVKDKIMNFIESKPQLPRIPPDLSVRHTTREVVNIYRELAVELKEPGN